MSGQQTKKRRVSIRLEDQYNLLSALLILIGLVWLAVAWMMPTTVSTGYSIVGGELISPTEVHNIGLQDDRRNHIMLSVSCVFLGVLVLLLSKVSSPKRNGPALTKFGIAPSPKSLSNVDYKLWLIGRYGIVRSDVLGSFVCSGKEFGTADEAIEYADRLEGSGSNEAVTAATSEPSEWQAPFARRSRLAASERRRRTVHLGILAVIGIALLAYVTASFIFSNKAQDEPEDKITASEVASNIPMSQVVEVPPQPKALQPQSPPSQTSVVSSAWLIGWWAKDGFCEGDAGQSFLKGGDWGRWGVNGRWSLTGNRLQIEERELIADTESGAPETLHPPRLIAGEITKADKNSFEFKATSGLTRFERCED